MALPGRVAEAVYQYGPEPIYAQTAKFVPPFCLQAQAPWSIPGQFLQLIHAADRLRQRWLGRIARQHNSSGETIDLRPDFIAIRDRKD